jgi:molybdopterin converting factor small subunit
MPNTIHIPTPLRPFTDKQESVQVSGATVGELLADLTKKHDGLKKHLYTDEGKLRNFVNVYLNDAARGDARQAGRQLEHRAVRCWRRH